MAKKLTEYIVYAPKIKFGEKVAVKGDKVKLDEDKAANLLKKGYIGKDEDKEIIEVDVSEDNSKGNSKASSSKSSEDDSKSEK